MLNIECYRVDYDNSSKGWDGVETGSTFFYTKEEAEEAVKRYKKDDEEEGIFSYEYFVTKVKI